MAKSRCRVGDWVEVRSKDEIVRTLDRNGMLDGMPFMPEMFTFCGKRFQVFKRAHKTCDTVFPIRGRRLADAVHLETRCDGAAHGGCQAGCLIFWKEAWLKKVGDPAVTFEQQANRNNDAEKTGAVGLGNCCEQDVWSVAVIPAADDHSQPRYMCQATHLPYFTTNLVWWDVRQYVEDYTSGNVGLWRMFQSWVFSCYYHVVQAGIGVGPALRWMYDRFRLLWRGSRFPRTVGTIPRDQSTPQHILNLREGELVRVKSHEEILQTLNVDSKNRGMYWDAEMVPYCGGTHRVLTRVDRLVDEKTGAMLQMKTPAVILDGAVCQARYSCHRLFCPRSLFPFWREAWLERVSDSHAVEKAGAASR